MKSFVSLEYKLCPICAERVETNTILLDTRVRNGKLMESLDLSTCTGYALCATHKTEADEGWVFLIETSPRTLGPTGSYAKLRASVFEQIFDIPLPPHGFAYCEPGLLELLQSKTAK